MFRLLTKAIIRLNHYKNLTKEVKVTLYHLSDQYGSQIMRLTTVYLIRYCLLFTPGILLTLCMSRCIIFT
jgi:hypothetical protein